MGTAPNSSAVDLRRATDRFATHTGWLESRHCFSFGRHYDPANTHFGLLMVSNDDVVAPGTGFETHPHRDMEIVTWVLSGALVHQDSEGNSGVIHPGLAQRMSAGTGILHSEKNDAWRLTDGPEHDEPVHFVQMWVVPDEAGIRPGYEQLDIGAELARGGMVTVASGMPAYADRSAIRIRQRHAALHVARLAPGRSAALPTAPYVHVYVTRGSVELEGAGPLHVGEAARITGAQGQRLTAPPPTVPPPTAPPPTGSATPGDGEAAGAEVLVWEMAAAR